MFDCLFCKIIKGEIPSQKVYEDEDVLAFQDIHPKAPIHLLVVPKSHIESLVEVREKDKEMLGNLFLKVQKVASDAGLDKDGYKIVMNNGKGSGQVIFHLHVHILGGWKKSPNWEV